MDSCGRQESATVVNDYRHWVNDCRQREGPMTHVNDSYQWNGSTARVSDKSHRLLSAAVVNDCCQRQASTARVTDWSRRQRSTALVSMTREDEPTWHDKIWILFQFLFRSLQAFIETGIRNQILFQFLLKRKFTIRSSSVNSYWNATRIRKQIFFKFLLRREFASRFFLNPIL